MSRREQLPKQRLAGTSLFVLAFFFAHLCLAQPTTQPDYLTPDLRARVDQLKNTYRSLPTDAANVGARAALTWDWINAFALAGRYVPVNSTQTVSALMGPRRPPLFNLLLDGVIDELAFFDNHPDGLGPLTATLGPFTAGSYSTVSQTYTVGASPVQTGGSFVLARHFMANFGTWQTERPDGANYVSITTSNPKVSFVATTTSMRGMHGGFRSARENLTFRVASGTLNTGDTVTITWGDSSQGGPGMRMATMSSDRIPLPIYITLGRDQPLLSLPIQPIRVTGTQIAGVAGFAPSVLRPGEPFDLSIRARDRFFNRATGDVPDWQLHLNGENWQQVSADGAITEVQTQIDEPGVYYITIHSVDGKLQGEVNPILVSAAQRDRVYWGDTHGHSGFAEGIGTPDRFMQWARDDARLDYVTHSEHDIWMDDFEWEVLRKNVIDYTEEGRFVAFLGYEWTAPNRFGGHHNVLFRTPQQRQRIPVQHYPTLSSLYQGLRATAATKDVVIIPHAHQAGDYRQNDPELEPLIEIMSQHGNFEWFGRMYLSHGHRVGFTAASDNHLSQPGYTAPIGGSLAQRGGLGAILAPTRTTDAIFDGMRALRSYATTGDRMILDFSVNGTGMGQRIPFVEARKITGRIIGTAPIDTITVFRNDEILWESRYYEGAEGRLGKEVDLLLSFASDSKPHNPGDNPRGWRIWQGVMDVAGAELVSIEPADGNLSIQSADVDAEDNNRVELFTQTRGDTSSYRIKLRGVSRTTTLSFDLLESREEGGGPPIYRRHQRVPAVSFSLDLKDLLEQRTAQFTQVVDAYTDRVSVRRIPTAGQRQVTFELDDSSRVQGDYYFVRVRQANDAMAWSSPIWVGGYDSR